MPRIAGLNVVGIIAATLVFYFVGFIFYGVLFTREWSVEVLASVGAEDMRTLSQMTTERLTATWNETFPNSNPGTSMGVGFINALGTVVVLAFILRQLTSAAPSLGAYLMYALLICTGFVLTTLAYDHIYAMAPMKLLMIDTLHLYTAYAAAAITLSFLD